MASDRSGDDGVVLTVEGLVKTFNIHGNAFRRRTTFRAVDGVDLAVHRNETLGLVGESGCGKSTTARAIVGLLAPDEGVVTFDGVNIAGADHRTLRVARRRLQIVFQDPMGSLNPQRSIFDSVVEGIREYNLCRRGGERSRVVELLEMVGLGRQFADRFPHELSGGQCQRVGIARALALEPELLVLDEPLSALDVSVQAQILELLQSLQHELGISYLLISHDLSVVRYLAHRVAVMYLGRIVEVGPASRVLSRPEHPYTEALLSAVPRPDPERRGIGGMIVLEGEPPNPLDPPSGCPFRTRCWKATEECAQSMPPLVPHGDPTRAAACYHPRELEQE